MISAAAFAGARDNGENSANVAIVQFAAAAAQIANWRHSPVNQRQFPGAVRFLPVRLLRALYRESLLSIRKRDRRVTQRIRRVLVGRADAPRRRDCARRLY